MPIVVQHNMIASFTTDDMAAYYKSKEATAQPLVVDHVTPQMTTSAVVAVAGYTLGPVLGKGVSAEVVLGQCMADGRLVALKFIDKAATSSYLAREEVTALSLVDGPHVCRLLAVHDSVAYTKEGSFTATSHDLLVLEYQPGGELLSYLKNEKGAFSEDLARHYFRQLLSSLHHCHVRGVCHRDVKPESKRKLVSATSRL